MWSAQSDQDVPSIGDIKYGGARVVGTTLRVIALLVLVAGIIAAIVGGVHLHNDGTAGAAVAGYLGATVGATVTTAGLLGAAGYVVSRLVDIFEQTWETRSATVVETEAHE
jgi:hypothetical protein